MKAAEAMAVAARSVEVVMAAKGAAVTVAATAKEEVAEEEAAVAEETVSGACVVGQGAGRRP